MYFPSFVWKSLVRDQAGAVHMLGLHEMFMGDIKNEARESMGFEDDSFLFETVPFQGTCSFSGVYIV